MLSLYRKYRPSTFGALIGQDTAVKLLKEAVRQDRIAHGYLLSGPRGTGKTSAARLIAKAANCLNLAKDSSLKAQGEPCNECSSCRAIDDGAALDVFEIDAASNRGIDEIRGLKEKIRTAPAALNYKVFIIDEAHMLTKEAANALLKTLEEPPPKVIIILATTEKEKLPATILSRTQNLQFRAVPVSQIIEKLKKITEAEKIAVSEETLEIIASSSEGSFRDAESLLDQLAIIGQNVITVSEAENILGYVGFQKTAQLAESILNGELEQLLKKISQIADEGYNVLELAKNLIQHIRRAAVLKFDPAMRSYFAKNMIPEHLEKISKHSEIFEEKHIRILKNLIQAYREMRYSQFPIIPLEVSLIESLKS